MPSRTRRSRRTRTPRNTVLLDRLKRLNVEGLAETGEDIVTMQGKNYLSLVGFESLLLNGDLKGVHLPYFNPLRNVVRFRSMDRGLVFQGTSFVRAVLSHLGVDELNREISGVRVLRFEFRSCNMNGASLDHAEHCGLYFTECSLINTKLDGFYVIERHYGPYFQYLVIENCDARKLKLTNSDITQLYLALSNFEKAEFTNTRMRDGEFRKCNFKNVSFVNTKIHDLFFSECDFTGADFSGMELHDSIFRKCTFVGAKFNSFLSDCKFEQCDLTGIVLSGEADLYDVVLENCILPEEIVPPATEWSDEMYRKCDNEKLEDTDDATEDKEDPISGELLERGTGMVMIRKQKGNNDETSNPDCFNRSTIREWFDAQIRVKDHLINPKNRQNINLRFFEDNGGFPKVYVENISRAGGRKSKKKRSKVDSLFKNT